MKSFDSRNRDDSLFELDLTPEELGQAEPVLESEEIFDSYDEIEAIFAHELAHVRMLHVWKMLAVAAGLSLVSFYLTYLSSNAALGFFDFQEIYDIAAFPLLGLILMAFGLVFMPLQNGYMRHLEKQADLFAVERVGSKQSFISAMTKLGKQNLSDPSPSRLVEFFLYDHPPMSKRLQYAEQRTQDGKGDQVCSE